MAATFHLQIVTPDRAVFDGMAEKVILRTVTGDVCILARHIDYAAPLGIGEAKVTDESGKTRTAACNGGLVSVSDGNVRVVATTFEWAEDIDLDRALKAKEVSEEKLTHSQAGNSEYVALEAKLKRALARIQVAQ